MNESQLGLFYGLSFLCVALAFAFAAYLYLWVKKQKTENAKIQEVSLLIKQGANTFMRREYLVLAKFAGVAAIVILVLLPSPIWTGGFVDNISMAIAYLCGTALSAIAGKIGILVATLSNGRTAEAAQKGIKPAFLIGFRGGAVMGLLVVGCSLLGVAAVLLVTGDSSILLGFSFGASSLALFAKAGGGIFTKTADVSADLTGKVELGIPEDDPRNPAVIADNVGDNVGDVAGMGADLYESYAGARLSACALAVTAGFGYAGMGVPMALSTIGIIASIIGTFFIKTGENTSQRSLLGTLRKGTYISSVIVAVASYFLIQYAFDGKQIGLFIAIIVGLLAGNLIGYFTEYYTSDTYKPTQELAESSKTGAATIIISGLSLGMLSTAIPVVIVGAAVIISFMASGGTANLSAGLFGISLSAVGMLSTLGITLATDAYGPVADNAGGIAEMSHMDHSVREKTDALDSLGNTTAATGKGFAIGSAALTALALVAAYIDQVKAIKPDLAIDLSIMNPSVLVGLFIGSVLPFVFAAMTMSSVSKAAQSIVTEVRRQFREIKGLMEGTAEPDYKSCVDLCTKSAQQEILAPSLLATVVPVVLGLILGVEGVTGMLMGATASGFILAIMMANAGGAWDNCKKYIESGHLGGKGSENHKAAVVGDTVGDPFKDTSGPAINILIKLLSTVSIVFAALVVNYNISAFFR